GCRGTRGCARDSEDKRSCQTNERPRQAGTQGGGRGTQAQRRGDTAHLRGREAAQERAPCQETPGVKPPLRQRRDVIFFCIARRREFSTRRLKDAKDTKRKPLCLCVLASWC